MFAVALFVSGFRFYLLRHQRRTSWGFIASDIFQVMFLLEACTVAGLILYQVIDLEEKSKTMDETLFKQYMFSDNHLKVRISNASEAPRNNNRCAL
jgi:hypothetical protein